MNRKAQTRVRTGVCCILSFFISMFSFLLVCVVIFQSTVLNEGFFLKHLSDTDFYAKLTEEIKQDFISYGSASGVDASHFDYVFSEIIPSTQTQQDVENSVHQVFSGTVQPLDTSYIAENLEQSFFQYAQEHGKEISDQEAVSYLVETCMDTYSDYVNLPYASQISNLILQYSSPVQLLSFGLFALILILAVFLFVINRWKHRAIRFYIYALSGTGLMTLAVPVAALLTNKIDKISLASPAFYDFAVSYLHGMVYTFFLGFLCISIFVLIFSFLYVHLREKAKRTGAD